MIDIQKEISNVLHSQTKEADRIILEFMQKKGLTLDDLQGNVVMQQEPNDPWDTLVTNKITYWYKGELILSVKQKFDITQPMIVRAEMSRHQLTVCLAFLQKVSLLLTSARQPESLSELYGTGVLRPDRTMT